MTPRTPITGEEVADVLAIAPATLENSVNDITAGKAYPVVRGDDDTFVIRDDAGDRIFCLWEGCAHLVGGNWTRSAATAARQQGEVA